MCPRRKESRKAVPEHREVERYCHPRPAIPGQPQYSGYNERTGNLTMTQLTHAEMQDRLSWSADAVQRPVWRRSPQKYPTFACNGFSSQGNLDQPRYKPWQHGRKPEAEGKGDSPGSSNQSTVRTC